MFNRLVLSPCILLISSYGCATTIPGSFSANINLISQYIYRGLTQTNNHPALQGGMDYSHPSGLYAGTWMSNISWIRDSHSYASNPKANIEIDVYTGFKRTFAHHPNWTYDFGILHYDYPGNYSSDNPKPNTNELYSALYWKWLSAKYSYSLGNTFGIANARGTYYLDLTAAKPIQDDVILTLHVGHQHYRGTANPALGSNNTLYTYSDYRIELAKNFSNNWQSGFGITRSTTQDTGYFYTTIDKNIGRTTGYIFIKKTF